MEFLNQLDIAIFYFINVDLQNGFFDVFMPFITEKTNWFPVWGIVTILLLWKGGKKGRVVVILIIPVILLSDQITSSVLKPFFGRMRPCVALPDVHLLVKKKTSFSFPSGHAANFFALAAFFNHFYPKYKYYYFIIAALVGISRISIGVHYPFDVLGGALIGVGCAYLVIYAWQNFAKYILKNPQYIN